MKRTTITLALLALTQISTLAQDWDKFGLKGKVLEATVRTEGSSDKGTTAFTEEGELKVQLRQAWQQLHRAHRHIQRNSHPEAGPYRQHQLQRRKP